MVEKSQGGRQPTSSDRGGLWNRLLSRRYGELFGAMVGFLGLSVGVFAQVVQETAESGFHTVPRAMILLADIGVLLAATVLVAMVAKFLSGR
jgi:hypothetical protein